MDRVLTIDPNNLPVKAARAFVEVDWKADTGPLHQLIDEIRATNPAAMRKIADKWLLCELAERDVASAENILISAGEIPFRSSTCLFPASFRGRRYRAHDKRRAQGAIGFYCGARGAGENLQAQPDYGPPWCVLGVIDAALGRKEEAIARRTARA